MANKTIIPIFEGRSAKSWLRDLVLGGDDESKFEAARQAFAAMGEGALPWLIEELSKDTLTESRASKLAQAVRAIGPKATPVIPALVGIVETHPDYAVLALSGLGHEAIPTLIQILRHPDPHVRMRACEYTGSAIQSHGLDPQPFVQLVPEILCLLQHEWHMLRWRAALLLGDLHAVPDQCIPALVRCLEDQFPQVQGAAATALGFYGDRASIALPRLLELSKAEDVPLRCFVISALGYFSDARVLPVLIEALHDRAVATVAIYSLGRGNWPAEVLVPVFCDCIKSGEHIFCWVAPGILGRLGRQASAAVPVLRSAMADAGPELREKMVKALERIEECNPNGAANAASSNR